MSSEHVYVRYGVFTRLTILQEPCLAPQEFPSVDGKHQQDSQGQMAVTGETCH